MKSLLLLIPLLFGGCAERDSLQSQKTEWSKQTLTVSIQVPDSAWSLWIEEVWRVDEELWILVAVSRFEGMGAQVISTVEDSVTIEAPDYSKRVFIKGKTWGWENEGDYEFVEDFDTVKKRMKNAELLFKREV